MKSQFPTIDAESDMWRLGHRHVAGVDEAGRGALAGPVVAAAVILPASFHQPRVRDSKLVPEKERETLYACITSEALAWGVGVVSHEVVDRINVLQSTFRAMKLAVGMLRVQPDAVLVDGREGVDVGIPTLALVGGDRASRVIAAASIVAKVTRDRIMRQLDIEHSGYGFGSNKGYGTANHRSALVELGPSPVHRITFLGRVLQPSFDFQSDSRSTQE